jgi:hypothetical protein
VNDEFCTHVVHFSSIVWRQALEHRTTRSRRQTSGNRRSLARFADGDRERRRQRSFLPSVML